MAPRKRASAPTLPRTPILEWVAAALGMLLTLSVLGYAVWEGLTVRDGPPRLTVAARPAEKTEGGYVVALTTRNSSHATAADVAVRATLERAGRVVEERRATFTYVPGGGQAKGGVIFRTDPATAQLRLETEGYEEP